MSTIYYTIFSQSFQRVSTIEYVDKLKSCLIIHTMRGEVPLYVSRLEFTPLGMPIPAIPLEKGWKPFKPLDYIKYRYHQISDNPHIHTVPVPYSVSVTPLSDGSLREYIQKLGSDDTPEIYVHTPDELARPGGVVFRNRFQQMRVRAIEF